MPIAISPQPSISTVGSPNTTESSLVLKAQRREVKAIATAFEADLLQYKNNFNQALTPDALLGFGRRFSQNRETLAAMIDAPLSRTVPPNSIGRQLRSTAVLGAGVVSRGAALMGAGGLGAAHCVLTAPLTPLVKTGVQAAAGAVHGAVQSPICLAPIGAVIGLGVGAVVGLTGGVAIMPQVAFLTLTTRGSVTKRLFRKFDSLGAARRHAAYKKMSTNEIAEATDAKFADVLADIEHKRRVGMRYRSLGCSAQTEYFPKPRCA